MIFRQNRRISRFAHDALQLLLLWRGTDLQRDGTNLQQASIRWDHSVINGMAIRIP